MLDSRPLRRSVDCLPSPQAYEEEFSIRDGFRWSPDGSRIAYWQINTEGVGEIQLVNNTCGLYNKMTPISYPKVGTRNPAARIGWVRVDHIFRDPSIWQHGRHHQATPPLAAPGQRPPVPQAAPPCSPLLAQRAAPQSTHSAMGLSLPAFEATADSLASLPANVLFQPRSANQQLRPDSGAPRAVAPMSTLAPLAQPQPSPPQWPPVTASTQQPRALGNGVAPACRSCGCSLWSGGALASADMPPEAEHVVGAKGQEPQQGSVPPTHWIELAGSNREHYLARMEWAGSTHLVLQRLNRAQNCNSVLLAPAEVPPLCAPSPLAPLCPEKPSPMVPG